MTSDVYKTWFTWDMAPGNEWLFLKLNKIYTAVEKLACLAKKFNTPTKKNHWDRRGLTASCFYFFAIYSIALKLHTIAFQFDWCFLSSYFSELQKKKRKKKRNACIPFIQDNVLFADHMTISNPPLTPSLISKVVSACSAICKTPTYKTLKCKGYLHFFTQDTTQQTERK